MAMYDFSMKAAVVDCALKQDDVRMGYKLIDGNVGVDGKNITLPLWMTMLLFPDRTYLPGRGAVDARRRSLWGECASDALPQYAGGHGARGLNLWFTLQVMGTQGMVACIEHGFDLARWAEDELRSMPDAEIVSPAQMAMVAFRFVPQDMSERELDACNAAAARQVTESGFAGVFTTEFGGKKVIRLCAIHPRTSEDEMRKVVRRLAAACAGEW